MRFGRLTVDITSRDKILFPDDGITKGEVCDYYRLVAPRMVPLLERRPITMQRYPNGLAGESFFHKEAPSRFPDWIARAAMEKENGVVNQVVIDKAATLVFLANQYCLTPHAALSRLDRPYHPDRLVFDLDPGEGGFQVAREVADHLRLLLTDLGLVPYCAVTGSRGIHVLAPLDRSADFDTVRSFARQVATIMVRQRPKQVTMENRKSDRQGRLYLDIMRNAYGQHAVAPYAVRARPQAPLAMPISWSELQDPEMQARRFTLRQAEAALARPDPWEYLARRGRSLGQPLQKIEFLVGTPRQGTQPS